MTDCSLSMKIQCGINEREFYIFSFLTYYNKEDWERIIGLLYFCFIKYIFFL